MAEMKGSERKSRFFPVEQAKSSLRNYLKTPPNAQLVIPAKAGTQAPVSITFHLATPAKGPPRPDRGREPSGPNGQLPHCNIPGPF